MPKSKHPIPETAAAIDLGSNSFHMIVARLTDGVPTIIDKIKESVRLGNGLDNEGNLCNESKQRALDCLKRFGQRLQDMPPGSVRAVGTNTLRNTNNAKDFLIEAEQALGHPIDIIAGVEEARLIYLGVAQSLATDGQQRFVMDIGGGSTEIIIGQGTSPKWMESLEMGCVSMTRRFFSDGIVTEEKIKAAKLYALVELAPIAQTVREQGWQQAIGASGSIKSAANVIREMGLNDQGITVDALDQVIEKIREFGALEQVDLPGLNPERTPVFLGGLIILRATLHVLGIDCLIASEGALREGLLYDLLGRIHNEDVRSRSVKLLANHYQADAHHAKNVEQTVSYGLDQIADQWDIGEEDIQWARWGAQLHEIGLNIAHSRHHHHGAYIIANADLAGFSRLEQAMLASLVRAHRRKFPNKTLKELPKRYSKIAKKLAIILRLAVILHRNRSSAACPTFTLQAESKSLHIEFPDQWLEQSPLTQADLELEAAHLANANFQLTFA